MAATRYEVSTAVEYEVNGEKKTRWSRIGVLFPLKEKDGFQLILDASPISGKAVCLPPKPFEKGQGGKGGI